MKTNNSNLTNARREKNDEFYTQLEDIENELRYYRKHFKDKVVLCNCDDPYESNFFKYFALNFNKLGLKKLISTCYNGCDELPLFDDGNGVMRKALKAVIVIDELYDINGDGAVDEDDVKLMLKKPGVVKELKGNGDFDSQECIELLKECDIVCTNPPFSLFRNFISTMVKYDKKFLVIGNKNAITYKEVFPLIKDNKLWLGVTSPKKFITPSKDGKLKNTTTKLIGLTRWFTNLEHHKRNEELYLIKKYKGNEDYYPKYNNYDAINVDKVDDIPEDYYGIMGVPVTFMDKYCPEQFEIIGCADAGIVPDGWKGMSKEFSDLYKEQNNSNINKEGSKLSHYVFNNVAVVPYKRILIQRK